MTTRRANGPAGINPRGLARPLQLGQEFAPCPAAHASRGRVEGACSMELFFLFGLFLGRGEPFQSLEKLFLGHPIDRYLGVVGIDAAAGSPDERH